MDQATARRTGRRLPKRGPSLLIVVFLLLAAGCTSQEPTAVPVPNTEAPTTTDTTAPPPSQTTQASPGTDSELEALWVSLWSAAGSSAETKAAALENVEAAVATDVYNLLDEVFDGEIEREVINHPVVEENDDGSLSINDCLYVRPPALVGTANWYEGRAVVDDDGQWMIESIELRSANGCVPAVVAEEVIEDYLEFWAAREEYWNPPQPDHPGVEQTMTGEHLVYIVDLLEQDLENGWYQVEAGTEHHPEIFRVDSPTRIVVSDCELAGSERGVFDADGSRQEGIEPVSPGQRDINEATMELGDDGQWRVTTLGRQVAVDCEFAPSINGVAQV